MGAAAKTAVAPIVVVAVSCQNCNELKRPDEFSKNKRNPWWSAVTVQGVGGLHRGPGECCSYLDLLKVAWPAGLVRSLVLGGPARSGVVAATLRFVHADESESKADLRRQSRALRVVSGSLSHGDP